MNFIDKAIEDAGGKNNVKVILVEEKGEFFENSIKGKVQRRSTIATIVFVILLLSLFTTANAGHNGVWGTSILTYFLSIIFCAISTALGVTGMQKIEGYKHTISETNQKISLRYLRFISIISMCSLVVYFLAKYLTTMFLPAQPFAGF